MKKIIYLFMIFALCLYLSACSGSKTATILTNDGEKVSMTAKELCDVYSSNDLLFQEKYCGAARFCKTVSSSARSATFCWGVGS